MAKPKRLKPKGKFVIRNYEPLHPGLYLACNQWQERLFQQRGDAGAD